MGFCSAESSIAFDLTSQAIVQRRGTECVSQVEDLCGPMV